MDLEDLDRRITAKEEEEYVARILSAPVHRSDLRNDIETLQAQISYRRKILSVANEEEKIELLNVIEQMEALLAKRQAELAALPPERELARSPIEPPSKIVLGDRTPTPGAPTEPIAQPDSEVAGDEDGAGRKQFDHAKDAKQFRAETVAKLINELNCLKPQMVEDDAEYEKLRVNYPDFLAFKIADKRPDLKLKILSIRGSVRHIRLAQELAAAQHGRELSTIQDDWKDHKPAEFKRIR